MKKIKTVTKKSETEITKEEVEHLRKVKHLRKQYPESFFLDKEYDSAVVGVGVMNNSIMYGEFETIYVAMSLYKDNYGYEGDIYDPAPEDEDDWGDFYDQCAADVYSIFPVESSEDQTSELDGKVPPTLFNTIDGVLMNYNAKN